MADLMSAPKQHNASTALVPRLFREVTHWKAGEAAITAVFEDFYSRRSVVVLGEPGIGKTTTFRIAG